MRRRASTRSSSPASGPPASGQLASGQADAEVARLRRQYLDLMKGALTHTLYRPMDVRFNDGGYVVGEEMRESVEQEFSKKDFDWADVRADGRDWPRFAQTMVGLKRLDNVQHCVEQVLADDVPGDLIETGVWRGGVVIFMRAILEAYGDRDRIVFAADSFQGLPPPDDAAYPADTGSRLHTAEPLAVSRDEVERNFELYGLLDDRVQFLEGWFKDTLPTVADRTWAVDPTRRRHVRVDDGRAREPLPAARRWAASSSSTTTRSSRASRPSPTTAPRNGIDEPIEAIDWLGAFWRRSRA